MKKIFKIIIFNILFIFIILVIFEFYFCYTDYKHSNIKGKEYLNFTYLSLPVYDSSNYKDLSYFASNYIGLGEEASCEDFRKPSGTKYLKQNEYSIILGGCSFTYGPFLKDNETFSSVLSAYTKRHVYNIAADGASPRLLLYILRFDNIRNSFLNNNKKVQYVIYTFIPDHKFRLIYDLYRFEPNFRMTNNKNSLEYYVPKTNKLNLLLKRSFIWRKIYKVYYDNRTNVYYNNNTNEINYLFYLYMKEINKEIQKHFVFNKNKKTKFVIIVYEEDTTINWKSLEDEGIIVFQLKDLVKEDLNYNDEYKTIDHLHPNKKAWELIVPPLAEKLNI